MTVKFINKIIILGGIASIVFSHQTSGASDAHELHRTSCIACHAKMTGGDGGVLYKRTDRIVNNKIELAQRVAYCANGAHTNWNDAEVTAVTNYLNELIYQFP